MKNLRRCAAVVLAIGVLVALTGGPALAAAPTPVGNDVSYPQCGRSLPTNQEFAIVGVNRGTASTTNPCLGTQLAWAQTSKGTTSQPRVALYVNTGNPGLAGSWWPVSNNYPSQATAVPNPYGTCTGGVDAACAYIYGYAKAYDDATIRGVPNPAGYFVWLDVELGNSWSPDKVANRAVLEGMTYFFSSVLGAPGVGIYSTTYQWGQIVGSVGRVGGSNLDGLPSWIPGATTLKGAQQKCSSTPLTGGSVTVTQYVSGSLDYDFACP